MNVHSLRSSLTARCLYAVTPSKRRSREGQTAITEADQECCSGKSELHEDTVCMCSAKRKEGLEESWRARDRCRSLFHPMRQLPQMAGQSLSIHTGTTCSNGRSIMRTQKLTKSGENTTSGFWMTWWRSQHCKFKPRVHPEKEGLTVSRKRSTQDRLISPEILPKTGRDMTSACPPCFTYSR